MAQPHSGAKVRELFPEGNKLINNGKKVFLKAPRRVEVYREIMKDKQLPPQPILTRWGTWLNAALFYSENLAAFKEVVEALEEDAICVQKLKGIVIDNYLTLKSSLIFIKTYLSFIPKTITKLEKRGLLLKNYVDIIN